ncbi:hypothetical protein AKJ09_05154 [Labilithrix luteola]|uniref:PEGA domain-containing protein n=1 Tax=Labilithrix luteola TaxID=1391654 RepID=A0A0K1PY84_9BACT|nr:hypothetical protein [Labilithrix luteola]AKU98490.1 hypothetical protein AKJ09_05154 [Labilithrix luteola]
MTCADFFQRRRSRGLLTLVMLATLAMSSAAAAEPSARERAAAEAIFREAKQLAAQGKISEACVKFAESHRLEPKLGTLLHLATCHELEGKTATAWIEFTEASRIAERTRQPDREKLARTHAQALEAELPTIRIVVSHPVPGQDVKLDDTPLTEGTLGSDIPIDPGEHVLTARAASKTPWSRKVTIERGHKLLTVEIPALEDKPIEASPPVAGSAAATPRNPPDTAAARVPAKSRRTLGWVLVGAAGVGLGVGTFFGLRAASEESDANTLCPTRTCPTSEGLDGHDAARRSALFSTIGFGAGILAGGVAAYLLLTEPLDAPRTSLRLVPSVGREGGGLDAVMRF